MLKGSLRLAALASLFMTGAAFAQEKIKVGVTATLEGTYTVLGEDGMRGFQTALNKFGTKIGDKQLEFVVASTDATPDSAVRAVRKLIEQDKAQILLSPLSGDEGIAVKNFAKTHPELTFINAASGAQETTYVDPAPNFFRYNMDGAQWQVGLGKYAYENKGYRKIAAVGEDYSFIYTQVFGLVLEFCGADGQITSRQWVPLGTRISPRLSPRCRTTSMRFIWGSAAPTPSISSTNTSRRVARHICSVVRSWSTRPFFRQRATLRTR
jgi:branched-chain amino acid transport system substrate-binding protein